MCKGLGELQECTKFEEMEKIQHIWNLENKKGLKRDETPERSWEQISEGTIN